MSRLKSAAIGAGIIVLAGTVAAVARPGGGHPGGQPHMMKMFKKLDADKDQVITREEAEAAAKARFEKLDGDDDGVVTSAEIDKALEERLNRMRVKMRYRMLMRLDTDGDGKIAREELRKKALKRFESADSDGDGKVTREEARKLGHAMRRMMKHGGGMGRGMMGGGAKQ